MQRLIDAVVRNEGEPDVVQISGGEPTVHPDFFAILDRAKKAPIRHLMVNTNGLRIAHDEEFAKRLAGYMPDFEVYLQFDSLAGRAAPGAAWRGSPRRPCPRPRAPESAWHLDDAGGHAEEGTERR